MVPEAFPVAHVIHAGSAAWTPDHMRLRSVLAKAFTPKRIAALRPRVESITELCWMPHWRVRGDARVVGDLSISTADGSRRRRAWRPGTDWSKFQGWAG